MKRKQNKVTCLFTRDGSWSNDEDMMKKEALNFFQELFCSTELID